MRSVRYGLYVTAIMIVFNIAVGQVLLEENFNFSGNLTANGWSAHSGGGTAPIATTTGLTYSGYLSSGIGNAAYVAATGEDDNKTFTSQTSGTLYYAFLVKVDVAVAGYFTHLGTSTSTFAARVFVQPSSSNIQFGLSNSSTGTYNTTTNFSTGTTYLCVVKYDVSATGACSLWVITSGVPANEAAAGTPLVTATGTGSATITYAALRQYNASQRYTVDGIRVAQSWSDAVASASVPSISLSKSSLAFGSVLTGNTSAEETFNVSGINLTTDITVKAPSGYTVSKISGGPYTDSVVVAHSGGIVSSTPIYSVFSPVSTGTYAGNITNASTGATTQNVSVTGNGVTNYYSASTGNLDVLATWGTATDGTGANPTDFTSNYQVFNVRNNATPAIAASWTVSGTGSKIVLGNGTDAVNFTIPDAMTVTGTIDLSANGTLTLQNATLSHTYGTVSSTSTINYAQSGTYTIPASPTTYGNLKITGGTKTLSSGTLTIQNITVDGVTDFNGAGTPFSTLNIAGNFTLLNGTTFAADVANRFTVNCNGSSAQTFFGNGAAFHLFRILMNNSNGLTLSTSGGSSNVTVGNTNASAGGVTLTSGGITTNSNAITFYNASGAVIQSPVETAGKEIVGTIIMTRTVGTGASTFGASGLSLAAGTDDLGDVTVTRVTGTLGIVSVGANSGIARKYTVSSTNPPTAGRDVTVTWLSSNDNSKTLTSGTAWKSTNSGSTWSQVVSGDYSTRTVTMTGQTSFGMYTISDNTNPLPVELVSFTTSVARHGVELAWKTATEVNNAGFEIQRSEVKEQKSDVRGQRSEESWIKVGFVEGNGTTNSPKSYSYTDASAKGSVSYRLKQIDRDGQFEYSAVVNATVAMTAADYELSQNFPNPFNPNTNITFAMKNAEQVNVTVYNALGQSVATLFNDVANANQVYTLNFEGKNLSSGTYFYALRSASRNEVRKMSLMK